MRRIDSRTVEFDPAESVVTDWLTALINDGMDLPGALAEIAASVPDDSLAFKIVHDPDFRAHWLGDDVPADSTYCRCESPDWVAGMMVVSPEDVETVHQARAELGETVECQTCGGTYHPDHARNPHD